MCKKEFIENYFNKDEKDKDKWLNFKNDIMPNSLFKYTRANNHIYDLICDDLLFLPKIEKLNDPYEIQLFYDIDKVANEFSFKNGKVVKKEINGAEIEAQYFKDMEPEDKKELNDIIRDMNEIIKNKMSITCLSERNDINPLWAHYADNHTGICIEYDLKNCNNFFLKTMCFPVNYVEKNDNTEDVISLVVYKDLEEGSFLLKAANTKSIDWKYEKEWRIVFLENLPNYPNLYSNKHYTLFIKPKSIYLGLKIDKDIKKEIKDICKFREINLYQMIKKDQDFILKSNIILKFNSEKFCYIKL